MRRLHRVVVVLGAALFTACAPARPNRQTIAADGEILHFEGRGAYTRPRPGTPGCLERAVRIPTRLQEHVRGPLTVKFAILADGRPDRFTMLTEGVPDEITAIVRNAVESCPWVPGRDSDGRPVALWVVVPLHFQRAAPAAPAPR